MKKLSSSLAAILALLGLAAQLAVPVSALAQTETAPAFCYTFTKNLGEGRPISSADAQALSVALINAGVWDQESAITTYDDAVASAVSGFQEKYAAQILTPNGLSYGTGFVGVSTRAELNSLYGGCSNPAQPAQPVSSTQCPAGYSCTPISQPTQPVCPAGFTCAPIGSTPPTSYPSSGADSAAVSLDPSSPLSGQTSQTSGVPVLVFDINSQNGAAALTSVTVNIASSGTGNATLAYLYAGSSLSSNVLLATAPVQNGVAHFGSVFSPMTSNTYQAYMVKVDTMSASGLTVTASVNTAYGYSIINAGGVTMTLTGSATGYPITINPVQSANPVATGPTPPADAVTFQATFNRTFNISSVPSSATLSISADNDYIAYINGVYIGSGPADGSSFYNPTVYSVAQYLQAGSNTIQVVGQNFYSTFTSWPQNAMGVIFKVSDQNGNILVASNGSETISSATIAGGSTGVISQPHPWWTTAITGASWIWDTADPLWQTYLNYTGGNATVTNPVTPVSQQFSIAPGNVGTPLYTATAQANVQGYTAATFPFAFTVSAGSSPVYISATPSSAVTVSTSLGASGSLTASTTVPVSIAAGPPIPGDTNSGLGLNATGSYIVPANSNRTFTVSVTLNNKGNPSNAANAVAQISGIYYSSNATAGSVTSTGSETLYTSGLQSLQSPAVSLLNQ